MIDNLKGESMNTFADKIIDFNKTLDYKGNLPKGIRIMNPFKENEEIIPLSSSFYKKYYDDHNKRYLILGINPGRFGGGLTGIPFTDPKRLETNCGIKFNGNLAHEPSSVFVYEVIKAYGGETKFYEKFYINSICPLGFTSLNDKGKEVNYNYYDSNELINCVYDFLIDNIKKQIAMGVDTDVCFFLGTGKNQKFFLRINQEFQFFKKVIALEHPRYIMQYKSKQKQEFVSKYIEAFNVL